MESYTTRAARLAAAAARLKAESGVSAPFSLAFMTDRARAQHPELVARTLPAGAAIVLRDYDAPERRALAARLAVIARARGLLLLVGADPALACAVGAAGVHWPSWARPSRENARAPASGVVAASCHDERDLERAAGIGADVVFLSPAFVTESHPGAETLGTDRFRALARMSRAPVIALGGVDERNARRIAGANVAGLAAIGAFLQK